MSFITSLGDWLRKVSRSFSDVSINGRNIVLTRHNGDTEIITTQDTDTTYNNATQSNDGLMSATDKSKLDNLPAWSLANSAGRASGSMIYNSYLAMRGIDNTSVLTLAAAEDGSSSKGAKIYLYGTAAASRQGDFVLQAGSLTGYKQLIGKADGTLTWNGVSIVNQNAFANVKVGSTTITADSVTDTIELVAGSNITLTPDATNDKITIAATDTVTTVSTTGTGNAVTDISASNGALTVTKGATYSLDGHTHPYLPLTGGTMSGSIATTATYALRRSTNDNQLTLLGGSTGNASVGAKLILTGADYSNSGQFMLQAGNSSGYKQLIGKPDGTLTWNGHGLAPMPISGTGVGHLERVAETSGVYSLPSGGTWMYFLTATTSGGGYGGTRASVAAGGSQLFNDSTISRIDGFIWRIA